MFPDENKTDHATAAAAPKPADERRSSGWDIANAARNYASLIAFQAGSSIFAFATVWLITQHLGSLGYGMVVAVIAGSQVVQVALNWSSMAVVRYGVEEFVETGRIAESFWTRSIILAANLLIVFAAATLWMPWLCSLLNLDTSTIYLVSAHIATSVIWLHVQMGLQAAKQIRSQGLLQMIERLLIFATIIGLVLSGSLDVTRALFGFIAAPLLVTVVGIVMIRREVFRRFAFQSESMRRIVAYSIPLLPFTLVGYFSGSYVDAVFISRFLSTQDLGVYSVATQINGLAMQMPTLANSLLLPLFVTLRSEAQSDRLDNYFRHTIPSATLLWGVACAVMAAVGSAAIPFVFGGEFSATAAPLWILLAAAAIILPSSIGYSALANSESKTYIPMFAGIASAVVNIAANFVLIPRYGMIGCAVATLLAYLASISVFAIMLKTRAGMIISWTFLAIAPAVVGGVSAAVLERPIYALGIWLGLSTVIIISKQQSFRSLYTFAVGMARKG